jgi:hypothetical protein
MSNTPFIVIYDSAQLINVRLESSTWRLLECVKRVIYPFSNELENKQVKINSDNKNVEHILKQENDITKDCYTNSLYL